MINTKSTGEKIFDRLNECSMIVLVVITVYPILHIIFASISQPDLLMMHEGMIYWPLGKISFRGYIITLNNPNILNGFRNSAFYVVAGTALSLFLTSLGAYALSRNNFAIKKVTMIGIIITMLFNGGLIPVFVLVKNLNMYDTIWAVILPTAINAFNLIIMRTFMQSIPVSLEESATIDGANDFTVYYKIILPLSKPVIAVLVLYYGVARWNSWFNEMIFLRNRRIFPLQLFLREILIQNSGSRGIEDIDMNVTESLYKELVKYSTATVATVPILCVYPFLQKYFVKGVMIGAIKG